MVEHIRAVIVGAGIVGSSIAAALARSARSKPGQIAVIERNRTFGLETSSRSSEVLHAGLYYKPGSLKAELCIRGSAMSVERCEKLGIACNRRGKLVIATSPDQEESLASLKKNAEKSGAKGLELWSQTKIQKEEPSIQAHSALYSSNTAVVDSHDLLRSYVVEAKDGGVDFAFQNTLIGLEKSGDHWIVTVQDPEGELAEIQAEYVINAAGLGSEAVAKLAGINDPKYKLWPCKGDYFSIVGKVRPQRLIYPVPDPRLEGLGVHLTIDVAGQSRLGPDATYLENKEEPFSYEVSPSKAPAFAESARIWLPDLGEISPDRSGIRPKLSGPGQEPRDFVIKHEKDRGMEGLINLIGIESPGLTAAPAIADKVVQTCELAGF